MPRDRPPCRSSPPPKPLAMPALPRRTVRSPATSTRSSPPLKLMSRMTRRQQPVRPDPLSEAAARRHELTRSRAIQALRELDRAGAPVTFASVAQAAGISRSWLYTQPDIRGQIRTLREKTEGTGSAGALPLQAEQQHRH